MSDTLIAGLFSSIATIIAPIIIFLIHGVYKDSKVTLFKKGDKFEGEWAFDDSDRIEKDNIVVRSIRRGNIKCEGSLVLNEKLKTYKLIGKQYGYCVTFEFFGIENDRHDETVGYMIFKKTNPNINVISGRWAQLDINGKLIGGKMEWKRFV